MNSFVQWSEVLYPKYLKPYTSLPEIKDVQSQQVIGTHNAQEEIAQKGREDDIQLPNPKYAASKMASMRLG